MRIRMVMGVAALLLATCGCAGAYEESRVRASVGAPGGVVSVDDFHDALSPYGRWIEYPPYGWCWTPYDMDSDWRPYTNGYWAYTDLGWTWVSNEPWGWGPYHYGRWLADADYGWVWVPGSVWAPAWVAWHYDDDWVGWAPLPPDAAWDGSAGLRFEVADRIAPQHWCFVRQRDFQSANLRPQVVSVARNVTLFARTHDATRFEVQGGRPVDRGIDVAVVERVTGRPVRRLRVVDAGAPRRGPGISGDVMQAFRPQVRGVDADDARPSRAAPPVTPVPMPSPRDQEQARRKLEQSLARERAAMERDHQLELQARASDQVREEVRRRHDDERKAFEAHAAEQRQWFERRWQKQVVKPGKGSRPEKDKREGERHGKGDHGGD